MIDAWSYDDKRELCGLSCSKNDILLVEIDISPCHAILCIGDRTAPSNDEQGADSLSDVSVPGVRPFPLLISPSPPLSPFLLLPARAEVCELCRKATYPPMVQADNASSFCQ